MLRAVAARSGPISIGIVGAGFAGLRCADILLQHGFKVTILEARNRLGGRVAQSDHLGHPVDLGPNWIHGTNGNPILTIAEQTNTRLHEWSEDEVMFDANGNKLARDEAEQQSEHLWDDGAFADAFRHSKQDHESIDAGKSLFDFFVERAEAMFTSEAADMAGRKRETFLQLAFMWSFYSGTSITRQSLKFFWLEEILEGENPFVAETYRKILNAVAAPATKDADIRLSNEVVKVISPPQQDATAREDVRPCVEMVDGSTMSFDEVVITTPLGWLKANKSAFEPALPLRLAQAIDNISYGNLDKVYVTFPTAFWAVSTRDSASEKSHEATSIDPEVLHPPSIDNDTSYSGFVHWLQPRYASSTNPEQWMQTGVSLAALPEDCAHPTLLYYIQGSNSKHIANLVSSARNDEERDAKLLEFFEPYYSLLPNYDRSKPDCKPKAVLATAWANDKFAGYGSYSNYQIGLEKGDEDIETMRHGMPDRHVWLGGEHTAPFIALGTSTGAYWSGEAVGNRIARAYGLGTDEGSARSH